MIVYSILLLSIVILNFGIKPTLSENSKKVYIIIVTIALVFISGFRSFDIGADTLSYVTDFQMHAHDGFKYVFEQMRLVYFEGATTSRDPGYGLFRCFVGLFSTNGTFFLVVVASIFSIMLGISVYKNSSSPCLSYILYITLFFSFFGITGIRQTIATAICVFGGNELIKKKRLIMFILVVVFAAIFHRSALLYLVMYPLARKRITRPYIAIMAVVMAFLFANGNFFYDFLKEGTVYDYYGTMEYSVTWTVSICLVASLLFCIIFRYSILEKNENNIQFINALVIGVCFLPLTYINPSCMRLVQYFSLSLLYLLPEFAEPFGEDPKTKNLIHFFIGFVLIFLFLRRSPSYAFIWQ